MCVCVCVCVCAGPGKDQEELRRKVENGVKELWYLVRSELKKLALVDTGAPQKHVDTLLQDLGHQQRLYTHIHFMYTPEIHSYRQQASLYYNAALPFKCLRW